MTKPIYVTRPSMPPLEEFLPYLEEIWDSHQLSNGGPMHQQLESALADYLGVPYVSLFANGTLALIAAMKALDLKGKVITTPYTFVATSHSLLWNGIEPVFADIDPTTMNLSCEAAEALITDDVTGIVPVHCYGTPCDVEGFEALAKKYNIKILYDAAHAFGVHNKGQSLLNWGDLSILSFHATKVFTTFEGGAIISHSPEMKRHIDNLKNFGFRSEIDVVSQGINGKMSEIHAAFGLLQLQYIDQNIAKRRSASHYYDAIIDDIEGIDRLKIDVEHHCHSYYPVLVREIFPISRDALYERLKTENIFTRRYFYPLLSDLPSYSHLETANAFALPEAHKIADQVICLPIFPDLDTATIDKIGDLLKQILELPQQAIGS